MVGRTNPGVVLPPGSEWSLTVGLAEDPPFQVSVLTGYEESNWSAPVARVLYLVVDLAAASLGDAVVEARRRQDQGPGPPHHRPVASALTCNDIRPRSTHGGFRPYLC